jgi:hypothetical protein
MLHLPESARRYRSRMAAAVSLVLAGAAASLAAPQLAAAAPPVTVTITVTDVSMPSLPLPVAKSKVTPFVVQDVPVTVSFSTDQPLSGQTTVSLTATSGPDQGLVLGSYDLPAGDQTGVITGSALPTPANAVALEVSAKKRGVVPGVQRVDVLTTSVSSTSTLTGVGAGGGSGVPCEPNATLGEQTCGDLVLPSSESSSPAQLLTQGLCTRDCKLADGSVLQWLATLHTISRTNPAVFVAKCDKSLCSGKGIKSYSVMAQTDPTVAPRVSTACTVKGVVDQGKDFCTDYVQSTRDGAGDVLLVVLFAVDAKIIW